MANNKLDKVYLSKDQLDTIANGGTITSGEDNYTADESALYLIDDDSVSFNEQSLTTEQKAQARNNIGAGTSNFSGSYTDLTDKPTIPTDNSQLTNGSNYQTDTDVSSAINTATSGMLTTSNYGETLDDVYQAKGNYASSSDLSTLAGRVTTAESDIDDIEALIPNQATSSNKLADTNFVNSSISTATATFRGDFETLAELQATSGDLNDYAYLVIYDSVETSQVKQYDRYKHNGSGWVFEYTLNNSSFTSAQWSAINSGITSNLVGKITTNENNINNLSNSKQDAITSTNKLDYSLLDNTPTIPTNSDYVDLTTQQTIAGAKTFTDPLKVKGSKSYYVEVEGTGRIKANLPNLSGTNFQLSYVDLPYNKSGTIALAEDIPDVSQYVPNTRKINNKTLDSDITLSASDVGALPSSTVIPTVNNASLNIQLNGTSVNTFTANASSNVTANIQALPNYSLSIGSTNGGNPRQVLFCSVNYTNFDSGNGAYFKLGAMSGHGNGSSYTFVEDIFINVNYLGTVTCNVYKYVQQAIALDNVERNYGDIFWTIDTTNKIVYFYILLGQYSSAQFTPGTKIGAAKAVTSANGIIQYTGTPTYYSSGTKVWATGNSTTYARLSDVPTNCATVQVYNSEAEAQSASQADPNKICLY